MPYFLNQKSWLQRAFFIFDIFFVLLSFENSFNLTRCLPLIPYTNTNNIQMSKKITLVEDDEDSSLMLSKVLSDAGYTVESFPGGNSIVENRFSVPDMFILDNFMPAIHGIALCKYLKLQDITKSIPVIIISANKQIQQKATNAGAACFLGKPFHSNDLLNVVEIILRDNTGK